MKGELILNTIENKSENSLKFYQSHKFKINVCQFILHTVLLFFGLLVIIPFIWMITASLKNSAEIFSVPIKLLPSVYRWSNYVDAWNSMPFTQGYLNSFKICIIVVFFVLLTSSMAGYAFAKLKFPGRDIIFILFLATMMVPFQVTMIPNFIMMKYLALLDSHLSLIIPGALCNAFGVFLLRQFIKGIPDELIEAAVLDGCSQWQIYSKMIVPLIKAPFAALGIFTFMGNFNNFMGPLLYLSTPEKFTVPLLLNQFKGQYITNYELMMAAGCIALIPVLIIYIFGQNYIIEGITLTGSKS